MKKSVLLCLIVLVMLIFTTTTFAEQICRVQISTGLMAAVCLNPDGVCMGGELVDLATDNLAVPIKTLTMYDVNHNVAKDIATNQDVTKQCSSTKKTC